MWDVPGWTEPRSQSESSTSIQQQSLVVMPAMPGCNGDLGLRPVGNWRARTPEFGCDSGTRWRPSPCDLRVGRPAGLIEPSIAWGGPSASHPGSPRLQPTNLPRWARRTDARPHWPPRTSTSTINQCQANQGNQIHDDCHLQKYKESSRWQIPNFSL